MVPPPPGDSGVPSPKHPSPAHLQGRSGLGSHSHGDCQPTPLFSVFSSSLEGWGGAGGMDPNSDLEMGSERAGGDLSRDIRWEVLHVSPPQGGTADHSFSMPSSDPQTFCTWEANSPPTQTPDVHHPRCPGSPPQPMTLPPAAHRPQWREAQKT